jgi:hypothetical protein
MTSIPHLGGTEGDKISAQYVYNKFSEQKLDYFKMIDYDVLLDYPDPDKPNTYKNFKKCFSKAKCYAI